MLGLYEMNATSETTYALVGLGILGFLIGGAIPVLSKNPSRLMINLNDSSIKREAPTYKFRYGLIYIFSIITLFYLVDRAIHVTQLLEAGYAMSYIRLNYAELVIVSGLNGLIDNYIVHPAIYLLLPITMASIFLEGKNKILPVLTLAMVVLYAYCDGGRMIFVYLILHFFLAYLIFGKQKKLSLSNKVKRLLGFLVLFLIVVFSIISISEARGTEISFGQTIYTYLCGCMPHLDYRFQVLQRSGEFTYGACFFNGLIEPILFVLKNVGLLREYPAWFINARNLVDVSNFVSIGSQNYNAFVTPFYYFYADFSYIGVFIFAIIYGLISGFSYKKGKKQGALRSSIAYMIIVQSIIMSMVRWQFYQITFVFSFLYIPIFIKKGEKKV